ncbi:ABC transporter ATP-binding protein [Pseudochryseolinea flava]|uniref:ABC transporter ATP-binding protein n=1 Tax=Pseudochryseolinea flava TaxID=2059302 RepID=A0A364Y4N8_9BACT|nr:ATP-binding cassette domain-containing protein [Pseudochryseolinea flava]RAW01128.1 ABC transporter ATP-binding protein [Pseudochryseolinea flava]
MISILNLTKTYNYATVVDVSSLTLEKGINVGLVGNNGAGKTTLFRMLLDLVIPTTGEININNKNVRGSDDWKKHVGSFLDERFLISYLTPTEYFKFVGDLHHYDQDQLETFLNEFQEFFNGEILGTKKYIRDLSKGNIKKVGIVASLIGIPEIVVLDEPFENLDPSSQMRLKAIIEQKSKQGITFLISSHDLNHVTEISDRIVLMEKGKIINDMQGGQQALVVLEHYFNK